MIQAPKIEADALSAIFNRLILVIESRQVSVFRADSGHKKPENIEPHVTRAFPSHIHNPQDHGGRTSRPAGPSYYVEIAENLVDADEILILATEEGLKSAMEGFKAELNANHKLLQQKVVSEVTISGRHISEEQILEYAQEFYGK